MHPTPLRRASTLVLTAVLWPSPDVRPQTLLREINTSPASTGYGSTPQNLVTVGGSTFFWAGDSKRGNQLWKSDGTTAGTEIVKSTHRSSSLQGQLYVAVNGELYFSGASAAAGHELWKTDGTEAGTVMVKDIRPGAIGSLPRLLTRVGSRLFFIADDGTHGEELWVSDGTTAGTHLVKDFAPGPLSGRAFGMTELNGLCYFATGLTGPSNGAELWVSDGTEAGTREVKDIHPGARSSSPQYLTVAGSTLFFAASDATSRELWKSDGTEAGTVKVKEIAFGSESSSPRDLVAVGNSVFFSADDGATGRELWKSDGTEAGTVLLQIAPGGLEAEPTGLVAFGGRVVFSATDGTSGREPWISDGTAAGTYRLADVAPGSADSDPGAFVELGGRILFSAAEGTTGRELWASDGSVAGTRLVRDIMPGPGDSLPSYANYRFAVNGGYVLFGADDGVHGNELWRSDGSTAGTELVVDIGFNAASSSPRQHFPWRQRLFFTADDGVNGRELWTSDGSAAGTSLFLDLAPGAASSNPTPLLVYRERLLFSAGSILGGGGIYATDGTAAGTGSFVDFGEPTWELIESDGRIYALTRASFRTTMWVTDGTSQGTRQVYSWFTQSLHDPVPSGLTSFGGQVWLMGFDPASGGELWRSDGTTQGTALFQDLVPGPASSSPGRFTVSQGRLFFVANHDALGTELWSTAGGPASVVRDLNPGTSGSYPQDLLDAGTYLVFTAIGGFASGREPWRSDGSAAGTILLREIDPSGNSDPMALTVAGGSVFFSAKNPTTGREPWVTDGTPSGTVMLRDVWPGSDDGMSAQATFGVCGSSPIVLFAADDGVVGNELWRSDGTPAGTVLVANLADRAEASDPGAFARAGTTVFFAAHRYDVGEELHSMRLVDTGAALAEPFGSGCPGTGGRVPRARGAGLPTLGNAGFALRLTDGLANSAAVLYLSASASKLVAGGCHFEVGLPPLISAFVPTDGSGGATVPAPVPADTALRGAELFVQFAVVDPNGSMFGIASHSNGVELMIND